MNFDLPEESGVLRETVRRFALKEIYPYVREWERDEYFPREVIYKMGDLGFFGAAFPEKYGGTELGFLANAIVAEEIARVSLGVASSFNMQSGTCPMTILNWATDDQKEKYLSKIINCQALGCFAVTEPNAATDMASISTSAIDKGDYYLVNGSKTWITHATEFDVGILFAKTNPKARRHEGLSAFIIERDMAGLTTRKIIDKLGTRCSNTGELIFEDCHIPKENIVGKPGQGFVIAESSLAYGRTSVAARSLGAAQACLDASIKYANTREQFGVKIGKFQMIKGMIADMVTDIEAARLLVYRSAWLVDEDHQDPLQATIAKFFASEVGLRAAINTMKIHGAYGYSDEYDVARYYRDAMLMTIGEGTSSIQRIIIANEALGWKKG